MVKMMLLWASVTNFHLKFSRMSLLYCHPFQMDCSVSDAFVGVIVIIVTNHVVCCTFQNVMHVNGGILELRILLTQLTSSECLNQS
jgi:hypothetical protein